MLYEYSELSDQSKCHAQDYYWWQCLDGDDQDYYVDQFRTSFDLHFQPYRDYFQDLVGADVYFEDYNYLILARSLGFSDGEFNWQRFDSKDGGLNCILDDPTRWIDPYSIAAFQDEGVPFEDVYWSYVLPDPIDAGLRDQDNIYAFNEEVEHWVDVVDEQYNPRNGETVEDLAVFVNARFGFFVLEGVQMFLDEQVPAIIEDIKPLLEPDLEGFGPVFDDFGAFEV